MNLKNLIKLLFLFLFCTNLYSEDNNFTKKTITVKDFILLKYDIFFALSHGVHRGILKTGKYDDRAVFVKKLISKTNNVKFDIYGIDKVQPIWADHYFKTISNFLLQDRYTIAT